MKLKDVKQKFSFQLCVYLLLIFFQLSCRMRQAFFILSYALMFCKILKFLHRRPVNNHIHIYGITEPALTKTEKESIRTYKNLIMKTWNVMPLDQQEL